MSKSDPFGDAVKRALNRDPWAIPGEKKREAEIPPLITESRAGDMWGELCPACRSGWVYYVPTRAVACFGEKHGFDREPDGCGAKWRIE